ncbi:hypothetical protein WA026_012273 [Henosepilachna vigintioctopunctata]|uniref:Cytochrome P450 n=1 Tax=Henosepilachna vigintioctopunctata TaxID=420089 RepID=A0AAW1VCP4_9CUCU
MDHWMKLGVWTGFFILSLIIGKMLFRKLQNTLTLREIPSPTTSPILGMAYNLIKESQEELFRKYRELSKEFRPIYRVSLFHIDIVNLVNAVDIEQVLSNPNHSKTNTYDFLQGWLGSGLLTSSGEKWQLRRKLLAPAFDFNMLQDFLLVFNDETSKLVEKLTENLNESGTDISTYINHFTLHCVGETAMGWDWLDEGVLNDYRQNLKRMGQIILERVKNVWYRMNFIYTWTNLAYEEKRVILSLHRFTDTIIRRRLQRKGSVIERKRLSLLDILLKQKEEGTNLSHEDIREEIDTFLFKGYETTTMALTMLLLLLANHQHIQESVIKEIEAVVGKKLRPLTSEELRRLEYLECCIKETLRLFPSVAVISRIAGEEYTTSTGFKVPKGTTLLMHIYDLHRDPSVFPYPDKFNPDRFKSENSSKRHPFSYIPFSEGPRNCIGEKFALWELKTAACGILQNFRLLPVDDLVDLKFYTDFVLRTSSPVRIKFIKI